MTILGISAGPLDSAAVLVREGAILAAAQEERFTRRKHDGQPPEQATAFCTGQAGGIGQIHWLATHGPMVWHPPAIAADRIVAVERGLSHAASAFFPSPFETAAVLVLDDSPGQAATIVAYGQGNRLRIDDSLSQTDCIGRLYTAITAYLGFRPHSGEYKVMGLAPYGAPRHADALAAAFLISDDDHCPRLGRPCDPERLAALFGQPIRCPDHDLLTPFHMDVAASAQLVAERVVLALARKIRSQSGADRLCLAGGMALNCVINGHLARSGLFKDIWIQPAAGDAAGALGAALAVHHITLDQPRHNGETPGADRMAGGFLGPEFATDETARRLRALGGRFEVMDDASVMTTTAQALAAGQAVGWMQGRMEFGPRALGARSILGDPRAPEMQRILNLKIKYRESFRPFAPSVLADDAADWFDLDGPSPYMLVVAPVTGRRRHSMTAAEQTLFGIDKLNVTRSSIPAVTHVDYSARVQTVHAETNPRYHALISAFKRQTGCPVLVNTSFNVRGEPIVCTPEDAFACFMGTGLDLLVIGNCVLRKGDQDPALAKDYRAAFIPD